MKRLPRLNLLDRAVAYLRPGSAESRLQSRLRLAMYEAKVEDMEVELATHEAAQRDRSNRDWNAKNPRPDDVFVGDQTMLLARARSSVRDNPHAASIIRAYKRNVVGEGITPNPISDDHNFNDALIECFEAWSSDAAFVDRERKRTFAMMQRGVVSEFVQAAEAFVVNSYLTPADMRGPARHVPPIRLMTVEPEQLDRHLIENEENQNEIVHGIEVDMYGAPVAYHMRRRREGIFRHSSYHDAERLDADIVNHIAEFDRSQQTHGITMLAPVLRKMRDLTTFDQANLWAAKLEACMAIIFKRESPTWGVEGDGKVDPATNRPGFEFGPGSTYDIGLNEEVETMVPNRISGNYDPFVKANLRTIAAAAGISMEQLMRDFTGGNFSSTRQALLADWAEFDVIESLIRDTWLNRFWKQFTFESVMANLVPTPADFWAYPERYVRAQWFGPPRPWVDPEKEIRAEAMNLQLGLTTQSRILARYGVRLEDIVREQRNDRIRAARHGISLPENVAVPAPNPAPASPADEPAGPFPFPAQSQGGVA